MAGTILIRDIAPADRRHNALPAGARCVGRHFECAMFGTRLKSAS